MFDKSDLHKLLIDYGAGFIDVPVIYNDTLNHLAACALKAGRQSLPYRTAIEEYKEFGIHLGQKELLKNWQKAFFAAYDQNAHLLCLPEDAERISKERTILEADAPQKASKFSLINKDL